MGQAVGFVCQAWHSCDGVRSPAKFSWRCGKEFNRCVAFQTQIVSTFKKCQMLCVHTYLKHLKRSTASSHTNGHSKRLLRSSPDEKLTSYVPCLGIAEGCRNLKRHVLAMRSGSPTHVQRLTVNPWERVAFWYTMSALLIVHSFFLSSTFGSSTWGVPKKKLSTLFSADGAVKCKQS